jgi:hypothetical protein
MGICSRRIVVILYFTPCVRLLVFEGGGEIILTSPLVTFLLVLETMLNPGYVA